MCVFLINWNTQFRRKKRRCLNISKSANDFITEREMSSFLFVVLLLVLAETETALIWYSIYKSLLYSWNDICRSGKCPSGNHPTTREEGGNGREELGLINPFPYFPVIHECHVKLNPDTKKNISSTSHLAWWTTFLFCFAFPNFCLPVSTFPKCTVSAYTAVNIILPYSTFHYYLTSLFNCYY